MRQRTSRTWWTTTTGRRTLEDVHAPGGAARPAKRPDQQRTLSPMNTVTPPPKKSWTAEPGFGGAASTRENQDQQLFERAMQNPMDIELSELTKRERNHSSFRKRVVFWLVWTHFSVWATGTSDPGRRRGPATTRDDHHECHLCTLPTQACQPT